MNHACRFHRAVLRKLEEGLCSESRCTYVMVDLIKKESVKWEHR